MGLVNRALLRNLARIYADGRPNGANAFIVDSDATANAVSLDTLVNLAIAKFYDMLVAARGHEYYAVDVPITMVVGTQQYQLPTNFYQLLTAHLEWDVRNFEQLHDTSQYERTQYQNWQTWARWSFKAYRLLGTQQASAQTIELWPAPTAAGTILRVRYIPQFAPLTDDTTNFDSVNGWEKFIALAAAIDYRTAAGKDLGNLASLYQEELTRIESMADKRAANAAPTIIDVNPEVGINEWSGDRRWIA
jgi:hypothetical protein